MKPMFGFTIICICLILSSLTGIVAADSAQYDKCVNIYMNIDNGIITTQSTEIYYGSPPNLFPVQEGFKGELVAADGSTVKTFTVWDPRVQFGDVVVSNSNNPQIKGVVDRQNSVDFVVTLPFDRTVTEFRLYDSADGPLLTSVNLKPRNSGEEPILASVSLKPQIDSFFASYPNDPDNPESYGSKVPVSIKIPENGIPGPDNPTSYGSKVPATVNPLPTATPDPGAKTSGQLLGIQAIGSGAVLLLGGAFASVRFLRKKPKKVLIVDDNPDIIEVIAGMLKISGYATRIANSGKECLMELESAIPDLILMDIGMEPMDGWETLKTIKKNPATHGIPVIMLTALRLTPKDVEDYGICIEDYVVKPVTTQDLNDAITHVFARRQMIKEKIAAANGAGIDRNELCECARLTRVVDVNKRLWNLLVKTYNLEDGKDPDSEITHAIKNTERKIRDQEYRLEEIQRNFGSGARG
jgi:CheY-like chemotaxis protein